MTAESNSAQVYRLFAQAMELESSARIVFVQEQCGHDAQLLKQVESLIAIAETEGVTGVVYVSGHRAR